MAGKGKHSRRMALAKRGCIDSPFEGRIFAHLQGREAMVAAARVLISIFRIDAGYIKAYTIGIG
jgi:hypothetical protein